MSAVVADAAISPEHFRAVLGHLPTGVTVLAAQGSDGPVGMCCNSVISVSLEPPLIAFCPTRASRTWSAIRASGRCCINVMASHHAQVARRFAAAVPDRFANMSLHDRPGGPALDDAVAWIDCEVTDVHEAGDHLIVVAGVVALHARLGAEPLVFFRGDFGRLGADVRAT